MPSDLRMRATPLAALIFMDLSSRGTWAEGSYVTRRGGPVKARRRRVRWSPPGCSRSHEPATIVAPARLAGPCYTWRDEGARGAARRETDMIDKFSTVY